MADEYAFTKRDLNHFKKDIMQLARVSYWIDRFYYQWQSDIDKYKPKYKKFIEDFNKKYKGIKVKVKYKIEKIETKFLLDEKTIKGVFDSIASKIVGLKAAGAARFDVVDVADGDSFVKEVERGKKKLHLTYYDPDIGTRYLFLSFDKTENMVRLHFDNEQVGYDTSPDFKVASYYALRKGYDKKIDIHDDGGTFGFDDLLSEREKARWLTDKLDTDVQE